MKGPQETIDADGQRASGRLPADPSGFVTRNIPGPTSWLERPLSAWWCAVGWLAATAVFIGVVRLHGGVSHGDVEESVYSTWAIAHGNLACAYAPGTAHGFPFIAPLWPLLSGALAAFFRIGSSVPFPSNGALGPHCSHAVRAMSEWSVSSGAQLPTYALGILGWPALMAGTIALLRALDRGRRGWEPTTLMVMACLPIVWMPVIGFLHPQDMVALGLALGGLACVKRDRWAWAGALIALAIFSQQFALLVFAPLLVVAPSYRRVRFVGAAIAAAVLVDLPVIVASSGRALSAVVIGSGNTHSLGGTVLWELHPHGPLLVATSRVLPIILSMLLARWAVRHLGPAVFDPVPLVSLIATSLSVRLVFEQNLFVYYFMALAVSLVVLDVVSGRIRGQLVVWLVLVTVAYNPAPWGLSSQHTGYWILQHPYLPVASIAALALAFGIYAGRFRWYWIPSLALVGALVATIPLRSFMLHHAIPTWFWQVVLVSFGAALAIGPLISSASLQAKRLGPIPHDHDSRSPAHLVVTRSPRGRPLPCERRTV